jgi:HSP20 family protein
MDIKDLIPWSHDKDSSLFKSASNHPIFALQKEMNQMFDNFSKSFFDFSPMSREMGLTKAITPKIDMVETEKEIKVTAELPGMEEKDIEVNFSRDTLVIKGEKKAEKEEKEKDYYLMERSYGSFQRAIPVSSGIDGDKVEAKFKNGVLTVTLPKTKEAQKEMKKIKINRE